VLEEIKPFDLLPLTFCPLLKTIDMTSIADLAKRLEQIDSTFDKDTQLKHVSFEETKNNSFGVNNSKDFTVFLPFESGNSVKDYETKFEHPLQLAFKQVLTAGEDLEKKICFIDMATLSPYDDFFTEGGANSVASALINAVDKIVDPNVMPVIRIICGTETDIDPSTWLNTNMWWRTIFEKIFWDDKGQSRLKNNNNATLWVGYYRPILRATKTDGKLVVSDSRRSAQQADHRLQCIRSYRAVVERTT
jgi:hypothetical protein